MHILLTGVNRMNHRKIAKLANVSASTVSKALSGSSEINEETAERIRQIAIDIGYFKEKSARRREYAGNSPFLIAVIVPEILGFYYATILTSIKNHVERKGGQVAIYIYDFNPQKATELLKDIILRGATDGVIMFSQPRLTVKPNIPIVCCCNAVDCGCDTINCDTRTIYSEAVRYLAKLGHTKIGYVGEPHTAAAAAHFEEAMKQNGLVYHEEYTHIIDARFEQIGHLAALKILKQENRPTVVIAAYDEVALGMISTLSQNGIRIPEDLSVMGINNIPSAAHAQIPLTSVDTFSEEQYKTAVDLLFDKISTESQTVRHITIEPQIVERETTKPR